MASVATVDADVQRLGSRPIVLALLTYNNVATVPAVAQTGYRGLSRSFPDVPLAIVNADAGSSDGTTERLAALGLPATLTRHESPLIELTAVPFHGVPGRGVALRLALQTTRRLGARAIVLLEADVTSVTDEWLERLARPVWEDKADLVLPAYARHRYDGTITNLLLAPLVRALYGRRLRQPLAGALAMSGRLAEHLLLHPGWRWTGRDLADLWVIGTAIADGFAVWEAWLGPRRVESRTRTTDLPTMVAQTLGGVFALMDRHADLWRQVRGSEPVPAIGTTTTPRTEPIDIDVDRLVGAFRLGMRDLAGIWEHILAPETLGDILSLDVGDAARFRFPDELWARAVYDFALGHHYSVVHREHLLRSLVPLYLGRTAAFVVATREADAAATEAALEAVGAAFERQKPYLVERW
ncbi:MAG: hypothetical protein AUH30_01690 [Candidatus Rokubacteria bacterium 13_1_40CM_68_15]|nr:MAG: hypothetical protein AUH30_01690 [Candidatus Rokubacteria bacterium 13_1_40CM_68_15]